jgi:hypothetical protein
MLCESVGLKLFNAPSLGARALKGSQEGAMHFVFARSGKRKEIEVALQRAASPFVALFDTCQSVCSSSTLCAHQRSAVR